MKSNQTLIALMSLGLLAGCGEYSKDPVSGLDELRANGRIEILKGPDKPRVITNEVIVEKQVVVVREEATVDDKFIVIAPDANMTFSEGQESKFKIRASVLIPGVEIKLTAEGLPDGAVLEKSQSEKDLYILTWTPPLYSVPANSSMKSITAKLSAEVSSAKNSAEVEKLKGLVRSKEVTMFLFRNQQVPSDLSVTGLLNEVAEGTLTPFTVTVKVPGIDNKSPQKPRLVVSFDGLTLTAGNSFLEQDGTRHIVADLNKKDAEYLGNSTWKFTLLFDTKNISAQPQLATDGSVLTTADGTRVRLSFKVFSPSGMSTPEFLSQVKIRYNKPVSAPRFDVLGLGQQGLEVSLGETVTLNFTVSSADKSAVTTVQSATSSLPGSPRVDCKASSEGTAKQDCKMTWKVPCDISADTLNGEVTMTAQSAMNGKNSELTTYKLKTLKATQDKKLCAVKAAAEAK